MTHAEFLSGMSYLAAGVGKPASAEQMQVYWDLLGRLDFDVFREAVRRSLLGITENFLPAAGAIYHHACDVMIQLRDRRETQERLLCEKQDLQPDVKRLPNGIGCLPEEKTS